MLAITSLNLFSRLQNGAYNWTLPPRVFGRAELNDEKKRVLSVHRALPQCFMYVNSFNPYRPCKVGTVIIPIFRVKKSGKREREGAHSNCYINVSYYNYAFNLLKKVASLKIV